MARLLLAAHDPGGANTLTAIVEPLRERGHRVALWGAGPAARQWRDLGWRVIDEPEVADLLVAATGMGRFEQMSWEWARTRGIASAGVVEAWTNPVRRFAGPDGRPTYPDAALVLDEECRAALLAEGWAEEKVAVVGQPHLERVRRTLSAARAGRVPNDPPVLAFVSEPIIEDFPDRGRGFDQYQVFAALVRALEGRPPVRLLLSLHPREPEARWRDVPAERAPVGGLALLERVDAVVGMTSAVLLEAALGGVPFVSLQPGRSHACNPAVDRLGRAATRWEDVPEAVAGLLANLSPVRVPDWLARATENSVLRFIAAIETLTDTKY